MESLTHNEIKETLAMKYQKANATLEELRTKKRQLLDDGGDAAEFLCYIGSSIHIFELIDGLLLAAKALGISKEELDNAVKAAETGGRTKQKEG